ncbi:MAG: galactokinase [Bacillota bacterium]|nr:galactokinase [Bacillota bacterium]
MAALDEATRTVPCKDSCDGHTSNVRGEPRLEPPGDACGRGEQQKAARLRGVLAAMFGADAPAPSEVLVVRAPGRVNLIGEHTDYNEGFVLPAAIDRDVTIAVRGRRDRIVRVHSLNYVESVEFALDHISYDHDHPWSNYVRGTLKVLADSGAPLRGMDMVVAGDVPAGAGLSSSAALEVATAVAARAVAGQVAGGFDLDDRALALKCQKAENSFVGVNCGVMDQLASSLGKAGHALFIDCRSYDCEPVPLPCDYPIVICDTGVRRGLRDSEYNLRRSQCEEAVMLLQRRGMPVRSLRDVSPGELARVEPWLPEAVRVRAKHVILENDRVLLSVEALRAGRVGEFGRLMVASHASLRDLYEVSCPELDAMVEVALDVPGVAGARMTGAGFGGCTVNLVHEDAVDEFRRTVLTRYMSKVNPSRLSLEPQVYVCRAEDGAGLIPPEG